MYCIEGPDLAELDALFAARLAPGPGFTMFRLDLFAFKAVIMIVTHFSVLWRLLDRIRVICGDLSHGAPSFALDILLVNYGVSTPRQ